MNFIFYARNTRNNKVYISYGEISLEKSIAAFEQRWHTRHKDAAADDTFEYKILEEVSRFQGLRRRAYYIRKYNSIESGYNKEADLNTTYAVYRIRNKLTDENYISCTQGDVKKTLAYKARNWEHNPTLDPLGQAVKKYGIDNFAITYYGRYEEAEVQKVVNKLIDKYDSILSGYNLSYV